MYSVLLRLGCAVVSMFPFHSDGSVAWWFDSQKEQSFFFPFCFLFLFFGNLFKKSNKQLKKVELHF